MKQKFILEKSDIDHLKSGGSVRLQYQGATIELELEQRKVKAPIEDKDISESGDFKCKHCGKAFLDKIRLNHHRKHVHKEKPEYNCKCGKRFLDRDTYKSHKKHFHGGK